MFTSDGTLTTNPKKISMEMVKFYSDLYAGNDEEVNVSHSFLLRPEIPKLTSGMKNISTMFILHLPLAVFSFTEKLSSFALAASKNYFALFSSMYSFLQENKNANLAFA